MGEKLIRRGTDEKELVRGMKFVVVGYGSASEVRAEGKGS